MGQCYAIRLKAVFNDGGGAAEALRKKIQRGDEEHTDYSLDHCRQMGAGTDTLDGLLRIIFGGWNCRLEPDEKGVLHSSFSCSYGWEGVMISAFDEMAPFLKDGSYIRIYPDSGCDHCVVKGGKPVWKS